MSKKRAIIFLAWGERFVKEVEECVVESGLSHYPIYLITDEETPVNFTFDQLYITRVNFELDGKVRKCELANHLPEGYDSLLFLDVDTRVIGDIELGFEKAELHGIAMAQATLYSLGAFRNFRVIMEQEGIKSQGQLLYNSGVVFMQLTDEVNAVFRMSEQLSRKYPDAPWGDQTYLTLAMEILNFNPYTLSTAFNHRAFGEYISGRVRIWHSYKKIPDNVNDDLHLKFRRYEHGKIVPAIVTK